MQAAQIKGNHLFTSGGAVDNVAANIERTPMRSDLFSPQNAEAQMQQPGMKLQNSKMLKVGLNGEMMVRQGAMVAYQGNIQFQGQGAGGIGKFVKQQLTGEGVPLM